MKKPFLFVLLAFSGVSLEAATITSQSPGGDWSAAGTWQGGIVPGQNDTVNVNHAVRVDMLGLLSGPVNVSGTLRFSTTTSSSLTLKQGNLTVLSGGTLEMGTEASPLPAGVKATLALALGSSPAQYGLIVQDNGTLSVRGADKSPFAAATGDALAGATGVAVANADAAGWVVGDEILLPRTERSADPAKNERRTITGVSVGPVNTTVSWSGGLGHGHLMVDYATVVNLTRNAVIKSAGSVVGGTSAYVRAASSAAGRISLVQGEFSGLGANVADKTGVSAVGSMSISSSAFHDGYQGLYLDGDGNAVSRSVFALNADQGVFVENAERNIFSGNIYAGCGGGALLNGGYGMQFLEGRFLGNGSGLFVLTSALGSYQDLIFSGNDGATSRGALTLTYGASGSFLKNIVARNSITSGFTFEMGDYVAEDLTAAFNGEDGLSTYLDGGVILRPVMYGNLRYGLFLGGTGHLVQGGSLGYGPGFTSSPDADREVNARAAWPVFRGVRVNPAGTFVDQNDLDQSNESLISYNPENEQGTAHLWGDYTPASGAFSLDHAARTYASTATAPTLVQGTGGYVADVTATSDSNAVSQVITLTRAGGQWVATGSVSGSLGSFSGPVVSHAQFTATFGGAVAGDVWKFALLAASNDAGVQKTLVVHGGAPGFNGGRSRLVVGTGGLTLKGSPAAPTLVTRSGAGVSLTLISSGPTTVEYSTISYLDAGGLQLSGAGPVSLSSTSFGSLVTSAGNNAYVTANGLTSSATFYGLLFGDQQTAPPLSHVLYNVRVTGAGLGPQWTFQGWSGDYAGPGRELDPNNRLHWLLQPPAGLAAVPSAGRIDLSWTHPVSPTAAYRDPYRVKASSSSSAGPWTVDTTTLLTSHALTGLLDDTLYFVEVHSQGNAAGLSPAIAQLSVKTPDLVPPGAPQNFTARTGAGTGELLLTWVSPGDNVGTTPKPLGVGSAYAFQYSTQDPLTVSWSTSSAVLFSTGPLGLNASVSHTLTGLTQESTYYVKAWIRDPDGNWSGISPSTGAAVPRLSPPSAFVTAPLVAGTADVISRGAGFSLSFTRVMDPASLNNALRVRRVRDQRGNAVDQDVTADGTLVGSGGSWSFQPNALAGNSVYEVRVAANAADDQGNALGTPLTARFTTLMNPADENLWDPGTGVRVDVPAGALSQESYLTETARAPSLAASATQKLLDRTQDALRHPLPGSLVDLKTHDAAGGPAPSAFNGTVLVSLPYVDNDNDGLVDGAGGPVKAKTLEMYWLDESKDLWVRLPSSTVDTAAKRVTAATPHFTTFALIGALDADLSAAHVYPVPFRPARGQQAVVFADIGQNTRIEIFDPGGRLVLDATAPALDGTYSWDGRNADGENAASGVYFYVLKNGENKKKGKLVVIR
jgi:hypothetical protein